MTTLAFGCNHSFTSLGAMQIDRPRPGPHDVDIHIMYCGVCHSDLHQAKNEWHNTVYPCVPGHEIVGKVTRTGDAVTRFAQGDIVGVGCMIHSCGSCRSCAAGLQQYCEGPVGALMTYNGPMKADGTNTFGGYSKSIVVHQDFVLKIPAAIKPGDAAPLLCAGVTTYSPLRHWKAEAGRSVAIVGFGGLGHLAVKIAKALGATVSVISRTPEKAEDAARFGASTFILSTDRKQLAGMEMSFDLILSTIPDAHDINPYIRLLKRDGTLVVIGTLTPFSKATDNSQVAFHRRTVAGSLIGGIAETQEVLDFCAAHGIRPETEVIPMSDINEAFARMKHGTVRYRQVIDIAHTLQPEPVEG